MAGIELQILDLLQVLRNPVLDPCMIFISKLADGGMIWILLTLVFCIRKDTRKIGILLLFSIILEVALCNGMLKPMIHRIRPCDMNPSVSLLIARPDDYSFPSGHTGASFAFCSALFLKKHPLRYPAFLLASLIALSRMYLYVHYPTDILGGIILGILCACISAYVLQAFYKYHNKTFPIDGNMKYR